MVAPTAAGHYAKAAFSYYQHKIGLRQHFFPQIKAKYVTQPHWARKRWVTSILKATHQIKKE